MIETSKKVVEVYKISLEVKKIDHTLENTTDRVAKTHLKLTLSNHRKAIVKLGVLGEGEERSTELLEIVLSKFREVDQLVVGLLAKLDAYLEKLTDEGDDEKERAVLVLSTIDRLDKEAALPLRRILVRCY